MSTGVKEEKKISFKFPWDIFSLSPPSRFRPLSLSLSLSLKCSLKCFLSWCCSYSSPHSHNSYLFDTQVGTYPRAPIYVKRHNHEHTFIYYVCRYTLLYYVGTPSQIHTFWVTLTQIDTFFQANPQYHSLSFLPTAWSSLVKEESLWLASKLPHSTII